MLGYTTAYISQSLKFSTHNHKVFTATDIGRAKRKVPVITMAIHENVVKETYCCRDNDVVWRGSDNACDNSPYPGKKVNETFYRNDKASYFHV